MGGQPYQIHRRLLASNIPQLSALLSSKTEYGYAVLRHAHFIHHSMDFHIYDAYLQAGNPSYKFKDSRHVLKQLEESCPKCARIHQKRLISPPGPVLPNKYLASPLYFSTTGDLMGPYSYYCGRYVYKLWLSVFCDDSSSHVSILSLIHI